jgi:hypothetical protein
MLLKKPCKERCFLLLHTLALPLIFSLTPTPYYYYYSPPTLVHSPLHGNCCPVLRCCRMGTPT